MLRNLTLLLFLLPGAASADAQSVPDLLRGRVRDDSARAIAGASIFVTRGSDRSVQQTLTDSSGQWRVQFDEGTGDYLVFASAPGYLSARQRVQRTTTEREFIVDLTLRRMGAATLETVRVQAGARRRPDNGIHLGAEEVGASDRWVDGVNATLSPTARGDIGAMLGTVPGLVMSTDGASLLGASSGSTMTTLNGMALPAGQLPRGAPIDARFSAGTMDATRGGFAGGQFDLRLAAGNRDQQRRRAWSTLDPRFLQHADAIGRATGATATGVRLSAAADGEAIRRALTYNVSIDFARRASSPASLTTADAGTLAFAGLSGDSVSALRAASGAAGLPPGASFTSTSETWSLLGRFDDTRDTARVLALTTFLNRRTQRGVGTSPQFAPTSASDLTDQTASVQLLHQHTGMRRAWFNENRLAFSRATTIGTPRIALPTAVVGASSIDGTVAVLGGSPFDVPDNRQQTVEGASEWAWAGSTPAHRFRAIVWGRGDQRHDAGVRDRWGTWRFASIDDFANDRPTLFTRTIEPRPRTGTAWNGAMALAHQWRASSTLQVLSGVRIEGNTFGRITSPSIELMESVDGDAQPVTRIRTDLSPARVHLSPRLGLTWQLGGGDVRSAQMFANYGTVVRPSMGILRAGIGEFRDLFDASVVTAAGMGAGPDSRARSLVCVGAATPIPNWETLLASPMTTPDHCLGDDPVLSQRAADVRFLSPSYDAPRAWRSYVNYSRNVHSFLVRVEAMGAMNLALPGVVDQNFTTAGGMLLTDEHRMLFVPTGAIDTRSGAVSPTSSRRDPRYGSLRELRSDLRSEAAQLSLGLTSDIFRWRSQFYSATWTIQRVRQQYRGMDGGNAGDPMRVEWARGANDSRHVVLLQAGYTLPQQRGTFTLFGRLQSGLPFTPIVQGDIDGDGVAGDRAYIFDPSRDADAQRAASMRALLATTDRIGRCLASQWETVAARQSCSGPWTITTNARFDFTVPPAFGGRRLRAAVNIENLAGGLDLLLHGNHPHGWGNTTPVDPVLLIPRGFDPVARRFLYAVNPGFGGMRSTRAMSRNPFRITLDFTIDLTRPLAEQRLARTLEPVRRNGRWEQPTVADMERVQMRQVSSLHRLLLSFADTLFLQRDQIDHLREADSVYQREARALFQPLAARLAALPASFDAPAVLADIRAVELAYQRRFWAQRDIVRGILTPLQTSVMPEIAKMIMAYELPSDPQRWPRWFFADDGSVAGVGPPP